jgi:hypothetical protein
MHLVTNIKNVLGVNLGLRTTLFLSVNTIEMV